MRRKQRLKSELGRLKVALGVLRFKHKMLKNICCDIEKKYHELRKQIGRTVIIKDWKHCNGVMYSIGIDHHILKTNPEYTIEFAQKCVKRELKRFLDEQR